MISGPGKYALLSAIIMHFSISPEPPLCDIGWTYNVYVPAPFGKSVPVNVIVPFNGIVFLIPKLM